MCGLAGIISKELSDNEIGSFEDLMILSSLRGKQGSGIAAIRENYKVNIVRSTQTSAHLMADKVYGELIKKKPIQAMMGHCRYPTRGGIKGFDNVHPHRAGKIVGMHNGTMNRIMDQQVPTDESDSKLLFQALENHGMQKLIDGSWGAMALSWFDENENTINLYHNWERPLFYARNQANTTVWWASEAWMLHASARRRCGEIEVEELPVNTLFTFNLEKKDTREPTKIKMERTPYQWKPAWREDYDFSPMYGKRHDHKGTALAIQNMRKNAKKRGSVPVIVLPNDLEPGRGRGATIRCLDGNILFMNHAVQKLKGGCSWCGDPVSEQELCKREVLFVDKNEFICSDCVQENDPTMWAYMPASHGQPSQEQIDLCLGITRMN